MVNGSADREGAVMGGEREVAADVVVRGRRDVAGECVRWCLGVVGPVVNPDQFCSVLLEIVGHGHVSSSARMDQ
jgi:hypothetical protein